MMCTPFLVYTYAIHSYIALHVALLYDCLFLLFIFKFFFLEYTNGIHSFRALHLLGILYFTGIQHTSTCCSDIQQVYTRYILHITGIPTYHWINITWMVLKGILVSLHFITP